MCDNRIGTETVSSLPAVSISFPTRLLPAIRSAFREHGKYKRRRADFRAERIEPGHANLDQLRADAMDEALLIVERAISAVDNE